MRRTTRVISTLAVASFAMTTLSGCLATAVESVIADVIAHKIMDKINSSSSDAPETQIANSGAHHGGRNKGHGATTGSKRPIYVEPGKFSPMVYAAGAYDAIVFPRGYDGGAIDVPDKTMNVLRNFQNDSLELVNIERKKAGSRALTLNDGLNAYALVRSMELNRNFSHTRPNGKSALSSEYVRGAAAGENIAYNYEGTAASFINQWMNSEGHRKNILARNYTTMGIGVAAQDGKFYAAQLFGTDQTTTNYRFK